MFKCKCVNLQGNVLCNKTKECTTTEDEISMYKACLERIEDLNIKGPIFPNGRGLHKRYLLEVIQEEALVRGLAYIRDAFPTNRRFPDPTKEDCLA